MSAGGDLLAASEIASYRRDGYVVVRGLLGPRSVEACRQALSIAADRVLKTETKIWLEAGFKIEEIPPSPASPMCGNTWTMSKTHRR